MTDRELEARLFQALDRAAPDDFADVLSRCGTGKGNVIDMADISKNRKKRSWPRGLIAACLALVLLGAGAGGGMWYQANYTVASVISLDVNPSIELRVNQNEKVLSCKGLNADAAQVLAEMDGGKDLEGAKLDVAVNAIVGALVRHGYLDSLSSAILISVEDSNSARGARLQQELVATVDGVLQTAANGASVLSQSVDTSADLDAQAQANNISTGKAALVNEVIALNGLLAFEELAKLSVEELRDLIKIGAPAMPIGRDAALIAAVEYAGVLGISSAASEVDAELDELVPCYEVEINLMGGRGEFQYIVDAFTGQVLSGVPNIQDAQSAGGGTPESVPAITGDQALASVEAYFAGKYTELNWADARVTLVSPDRDGGTVIYEVELWCAGYEFTYDVDGATAQVLREDTDYRSPGTDQSPTPAVMDVGEDTAKLAALDHAGLAAVSSVQVTWLKCEREWDDGVLVYDLEFVAEAPSGSATEYDYTIDAATGAVLKAESAAVSTTPALSTGSADIGIDAAKQAALNHAGLTSADQVTWLKAQREWDDGRPEYELEFVYNATEYDYTINAADGAVLEYGTEAVSSGSTGADGDIGSDAAKAAALRHAGLTEDQVAGLKVERDYEHGRVEYEVEFRSGGYEYEYTIDGATGAVLDHEKDWDD